MNGTWNVPTTLTSVGHVNATSCAGPPLNWKDSQALIPAGDSVWASRRARRKLGDDHPNHTFETGATTDSCQIRSPVVAVMRPIRSVRVRWFIAGVSTRPSF